MFRGLRSIWIPHHRHSFPTLRFYTTTNTNNNNNANNKIVTHVRGIMRKIPQPVVVVTTSKPSDREHRRGITVSSFTSITLDPEPLVSFCVRTPSRASDLLHSSGHMVLNLLSSEQVHQSVAFSSPSADQFKDVAFYDDPETHLPVLMGTMGAMHCEKREVLSLGDHELWIAKVLKVEEGVGGEHGVRAESQPLLYYDRHYRSVGDQVFMKALEDNALDTRKWMHRAHLRMAWNYIRDLGRDKAEPVIKEAIKSRFNAASTVNRHYNETITTFYISLMSAAIRSYPQIEQEEGEKEGDFFALVDRFPQLLDPKTIDQYYTHEQMFSEKARTDFVPPDLKPLPTFLEPVTSKE